MNLYNDIDHNSCAWIQELVNAGEIPKGQVLQKSITEIQPDELRGYAQHHFFAGIAGWSYALKLAGWPATRPVWSASLPCQPFSGAGQQKGATDERHLWPAFFRLVRECGPQCIFGEQVARAIGFNWLDGISADLEAENYTVGSIVLGAHSAGAPHIRQRLYWMAYARHEQKRGMLPRSREGDLTDKEGTSSSVRGSGGFSRLGEPNSAGSQQGKSSAEASGYGSSVEPTGDSLKLADTKQPALEGFSGHVNHRDESRWFNQDSTGSTSESGEFNGWNNCKLIYCRDGKYRRVPLSGIQPLATGFPRGLVPSGDPSEQEANETNEARRMRLHGYGNAICPQIAAEFIMACMEWINEPGDLSPDRPVAAP